MDRDHVKLASILDALRTYDRTTTFENWSKNFDALLRPFLTSAPQADDDLAMRFATAETELHRAEKQIAVLRAQVTVLVRTLELVKDCCAPGALAKEQQPTLRWEHAERVLADLSGAAKAHEDTVRREIEQEYLAEQAALVEALRSTIFRHLDSTVHRQVVHFDHEPPCSVCRVLSDLPAAAEAYRQRVRREALEEAAALFHRDRLSSEEDCEDGECECCYTTAHAPKKILALAAKWEGK